MAIYNISKNKNAPYYAAVTTYNGVKCAAFGCSRAQAMGKLYLDLMQYFLADS